jgi:hypothetical protein
MKFRKLYLSLILLSIVQFSEAQTVKDFFIPSGEINKSTFYPAGSQDKSMETVIWYKKLDDDNYRILEGKLSNGKATSIQTKIVGLKNNEVKLLKTISTNPFTTNKEKDYSPPATYLKLPNSGNPSSWKYIDKNGATHKCTATWTKVNIEGESKKAIKVYDQYIESGSVVDFASKYKYYVEGIGLWKTQTNSEEDFEILDSQEYDPEVDFQR